MASYPSYGRISATSITSVMNDMHRETERLQREMRRMEEEYHRQRQMMNQNLMSVSPRYLDGSWTNTTNPAATLIAGHVPASTALPQQQRGSYEQVEYDPRLDTYVVKRYNPREELAQKVKDLPGGNYNTIKKVEANWNYETEWEKDMREEDEARAAAKQRRIDNIRKLFWYRFMKTGNLPFYGGLNELKHV